MIMNLKISASHCFVWVIYFEKSRVLAYILEFPDPFILTGINSTKLFLMCFPIPAELVQSVISGKPGIWLTERQELDGELFEFRRGRNCRFYTKKGLDL